jgi:hypothetical protein
MKGDTSYGLAKVSQKIPPQFGCLYPGAGLVLGLFGFILSGKEGFINMAIWGLALGLIGSFSSGLAMLINANY